MVAGESDIDDDIPELEDMLLFPEGGETVLFPEGGETGLFPEGADKFELIGGSLLSSG